MRKQIRRGRGGREKDKERGRRGGVKRMGWEGGRGRERERRREKERDRVRERQSERE